MALVREQIGPLACFKIALPVKRLPKTRSGKILRKLVRSIVDGQTYQIPSTIDEPESLTDMEEVIRAHSAA